MEIPLQISFRNMDRSPAVEERIREEVDKLGEFYSRIMGCRVMSEMPHRHRESGKRFHVRVYLTVPDREIVASNEPSLHSSMQSFDVEERGKQQETAAVHKDIYVAIRDAFKAARRQLQDYAREQRGQVKHHEAAS
jgi:ribosome-associated translation inhibitor RaiA